MMADPLHETIADIMLESRQMRWQTVTLALKWANERKVPRTTAEGLLNQFFDVVEIEERIMEGNGG